jgi:hypothetical protein
LSMPGLCHGCGLRHQGRWSSESAGSQKPDRMVASASVPCYREQLVGRCRESPGWKPTDRRRCDARPSGRLSGSQCSSGGQPSDPQGALHRRPARAPAHASRLLCHIGDRLLLPIEPELIGERGRMALLGTFAPQKRSVPSSGRFWSSQLRRSK